MSWICDLAVAAGLTLSGTCQSALSGGDPLPVDDSSVWSHKPPAPKEEPKPEPPPAPVMPPIVIRETIIREVPAPAPPPVVKEEPTGPDAIELAVRASYLSRKAGSPRWQDSSSGSGGVSAISASLPVMPPGMAAGSDASAGDKPYREQSVTSTLPVDNGRIITTDRYIAGILETGINTQLDGTSGGTVVIQVTRDVFGYHGRNILVPKGSRLVCAFKSLEKVGSSRAPLRCSRVLLGGNRAEILGIKSNVTDVQGGLGVSGDVDNRFFERYGTAFILAGVSAAVRAATSGTTTTTSSATSSGTTSSSNGNSGLLATGSQELSQRLGEITASALEQTVNLTPILKVAQGTRVQIRPDTDWYIKEVE